MKISGERTRIALSEPFANGDTTFEAGTNCNRQDLAMRPPNRSWIPGDEFTMGTDGPLSFPNIRPARWAPVAQFWIDKHDVINAEFTKAFVFAAFGIPHPRAKAKHTNIVILMHDDASFSDYGCFAGSVKRSNIDWLAQGGSRTDPLSDGTWNEHEFHVL